MQNNPANDGLDWTQPIEDEIDAMFIQAVQREVTQSCALPFAVPAQRIPDMIIRAARWYWANVDDACEERNYMIRNVDICKVNPLNKTIKLPEQIQSITGVHKLQQALRYGLAGDFSLERMLMSSYSMFGTGAGAIGGGMTLNQGQGYTLSDMTMALYEISTFDQMLNPPLTYKYNKNSHVLNITGDLGRSDLVIQTFTRCRIQDLYNDPYFIRLVVCYCKQALSSIYGSFEFKLPGGVQINYSMHADDAQSEIEEIKEYFENNKVCDYFFVS